MARLPTVAGDLDAWGTVLNDYLTETSNLTALSDAAVISDTSIELAVVPTSLRVGSVIAIDAYTTECELRLVTAITDQTVSFTGTLGALHYSHASGDAVVVLVNFECPLNLFAITLSGDDEWSALQRAQLECSITASTLTGRNAMAASGVAVAKPVIVSTSSHWRDVAIKTHASYAPEDPLGAMVMVCNRVIPFTADAATNTFTATLGSHGTAANTTVAFLAPYGETLPGGIVEGKVYYIKTASSPTFTISETQGGTTFDITTDGEGYAFDSFYGLSRVYWDQIRLDVTVSDVNGLICSLQQPGYITNLRIEMDAVATTSAFGAWVAGQIGYLRNVELGMTTNVTGIVLGGIGMVVDGFNCVGTTTNDTGIRVSATGDITINNPWTEQCGNAGIELVTGRGVAITGHWEHAGPVNSPALLVSDYAVTYSVCPIYCSGGSGVKFLSDVDRAYDLYSSAVTPAGDATDSNFVFPGWTQLASDSGLTDVQAPVWRARMTVTKSADYDMRFIDEKVLVSSAGGSRTITLPTALAWRGQTYTIGHTAGANTCTVDCTGSETINGAASVTVPAGSFLTVVSDNTNYKILAGFYPTATQTYAATNVSTDRAYDANATTIDEVADVLGTLIADLRARNIVL